MEHFSFVVVDLDDGEVIGGTDDGDLAETINDALGPLLAVATGKAVLTDVTERMQAAFAEEEDDEDDEG